MRFILNMDVAVYARRHERRINSLLMQLQHELQNAANGSKFELKITEEVNYRVGKFGEALAIDATDPYQPVDIKD